MVAVVNANGAYDLAIIHEHHIITEVNSTWDKLSEEYKTVYQKMTPSMERAELSFHDQVKLLGYLCLDTYQLPGDILEIGVWKGKSLSLMAMLCQRGTKLVGVDPCELRGQSEEISTFLKEILPDAIDATVIVEYSERAVRKVANISKSYKIIHIDGGHQAHNVWTDFILYSGFLVKGGYLVFDDYADKKSSPEVKLAVDELFRAGLFNNFDVLGPINGFLNSFVLKKSK